jgi:polysaccharide pyruvyl transferase WcaK-like protein
MIHHVFATKSNMGDWVSALGIQSLLAPHAVTEHLCDEPFVPATLERLRLASPDDLIVIGGGGLFMKYFQPFWEGFRDIAHRTQFYIWGVGYCDVKREMSRPPEDLVTEIIRKSQFCSVRDSLTRDCLPECQLPPPTACPSLCFVVQSSEPGCGVLHVDNYGIAGADVYDFMDASASRFAEATGRPYRRTDNRIEQHDDLQAILQLYAASDVVLSSALHGCIIGLAMGKKVMAVSGDRKIESFMSLVGLSKWVLDINDYAALPDLLEFLPQQPSVQSAIDALRSANKRIAVQILGRCNS